LEVNLKRNNIYDLSPIVDNIGLNKDTIIYIGGNKLDLTTGSQTEKDIQTLEERGVVLL